MSYFEKVRVRVAPSPTGDPHVGTAYVAVFNSAFARQHGGDFILRIEDTDQQRFVRSSEEQIYEGLKWLGLDWDEGPDKGGAMGPYRQSERLSIYKEKSAWLVQQGKAYHCFCSADRLNQVRNEQRQSGLMPGYDGHCRNVSKDEAEQRIARGERFVIRLKTPDEGATSFHDQIRGQIDINNCQLDDQVLVKSDGFPTYHLANVVDDHLMKISHVIRAEEWISSTPKHVLLYEAFGWEMPVFAHLPILRNPDKSKISKRRNPVALNYYRKKGILPEAMVNFLALMGWSFGEDREIFSLDEMSSRFRLEDVHPGGPVFDQVRLSHVNQKYIGGLTEKAFVKFLREEWFSEERLSPLYSLFKDRLESFDQLADKADFYFLGGLDYRQLSLLPKGKSASDLKMMLSGLSELFDGLHDWGEASIQAVMDQHRADIEWKPRDYFMTVRLVITGRKDSPPLAESLTAVGKDMVRFRIRQAAEYVLSSEA
ncbi:MAG: glutamate--tRNA ligase [Deltaproteobacteria bacterium]|nr:glutamate--tRNA ligase [Deltaproteobacteria bacterium]